MAAVVQSLDQIFQHLNKISCTFFFLNLYFVLTLLVRHRLAILIALQSAFWYLSYLNIADKILHFTKNWGKISSGTS